MTIAKIIMMKTDLCKVKTEVENTISGILGTIIFRVMNTEIMVGIPNKTTFLKSTSFCFAF